jgi:protein-S-isoprenylcysteine O-methyltransferase Ste14
VTAPATVFAALRTFVYVTLFMLFFGSLALAVRRFDPALGLTLPDWASLPGLALMSVGASLAAACAAVFVARGRGTPAPFDPPRFFVPNGPYRYVRNPMYIGGLALLFGFGLALRSASVLLLAAALFLIVHLFVVLGEEPGLARRFGKSYLAYRRDTNRWIPRRPPGHSLTPQSERRGGGLA